MFSLFDNISGRGRKVIFQIAALIAVAVAILWFADNAVTNLARQNIASGFGFLQERAGFSIIQTFIAYDADSTYGRVLLVGLTNTLLAAGLGIALASALGFLIGIARLSSNWLIARLAGVYIEVFRNIPLLLQIMFWYFGVLRNLPRPRASIDFGGGMFLSNRGLSLPAPIFEAGAHLYLIALMGGVLFHILLTRFALIVHRRTGRLPAVWRVSVPTTLAVLVVLWAVQGIPLHWDMPQLRGFNFSGGIQLIPELVALVLALGLYTAAFIAEIVRAGIGSVAHGQSEAAVALGLRPRAVMRFVIIPQAMRVIIPPLTSQYLNLTKNSSLAVAIAYPDIVSVFAGTSQSQTGQAIEIIFITMLIYLALSLLTSTFMNYYNRRIALKGQTK